MRVPRTPLRKREMACLWKRLSVETAAPEAEGCRMTVLLTVPSLATSGADSPPPTPALRHLLSSGKRMFKGVASASWGRPLPGSLASYRRCTRAIDVNGLFPCRRVSCHRGHCRSQKHWEGWRETVPQQSTHLHADGA